MVTLFPEAPEASLGRQDGGTVWGWGWAWPSSFPCTTRVSPSASCRPGAERRRPCSTAGFNKTITHPRINTPGGIQAQVLFSGPLFSHFIPKLEPHYRHLLAFRFLTVPCICSQFSRHWNQETNTNWVLQVTTELEATLLGCAGWVATL